MIEGRRRNWGWARRRCRRWSKGWRWCRSWGRTRRWGWSGRSCRSRGRGRRSCRSWARRRCRRRCQGWCRRWGWRRRKRNRQYRCHGRHRCLCRRWRPCWSWRSRWRRCRGQRGQLPGTPGFPSKRNVDSYVAFSVDPSPCASPGDRVGAGDFQGIAEWVDFNLQFHNRSFRICAGRSWQSVQPYHPQGHEKLYVAREHLPSVNEQPVPWDRCGAGDRRG